MRKPLTLFETLIAALLAAILFSNLLSTLFRLGQSKRRFAQYKEDVLNKADLHLTLKNAPSDAVTVEEYTLLLDGAPIAEEVTSFEKQLFYKEEGKLVRKKEVDEEKTPYAIRYLINGEPYTVFLEKDSEGFQLCK